MKRLESKIVYCDQSGSSLNSAALRSWVDNVLKEEGRTLQVIGLGGGEGLRTLEEHAVNNGHWFTHAPSTLTIS